MADEGASLFDHLADLGDEASVYLDTARAVAEKHFSSSMIEDIPLLTVQIAQLLTAIDRNRLARKDA